MPIILRDLTTAAQQAGVTAKGTQGTYGLSVQDLKDSGRSTICWTLDQFAPASASETMLTVTQSINGAATTTNAGYTLGNGTNGRYLWISSLHLAYEIAGSAVATFRPIYVALRFASGGSISTSSPLVGRFAACCGGVVVAPSPATQVGGGEANNFTFADGLIFGPSDGTKQIGFSAIAPGWVTATTIAKLTMTCIAFEY